MQDEPTGRELRIAIALALGYEGWTYRMRESYLCIGGPPFGRSGDGRPPWEHGLQVTFSVDAFYHIPDWPSDIAAAMELGAEAVRLGFAREYRRCLVNLITGFDYNAGYPNFNILTWDHLGEIMDATAEQRATAWYRAWKGENDADNR